MKKIIIANVVVILSLLLQNADAAVINGTLSNAAGKKIYLEKFELNRPVKIDSATISKKGKFKFTIKDTITEFFRLSVSTTDFIVMILETKDNVVLTGDYTKLNKSYKLTGSAESEKLLEFVNLVNAYVSVKDSINILAMKDGNNKNVELMTKLNKELNERYALFIKDRNKFLDDYPKSASLVAVTNHLNLQNDPRGELPQLKKIDAALEASMKNSYYHKSIHDMVAGIEQQIANEDAQKEMEANKAKLTMPGSEATDITMTDRDGKELKLSSLKGQYVLLDFWASWCGPCRKENPTVVKLYEKYKEKGFTVYSVSLDNSKEKWLEAIKKDNLTWPSHVSELKGWQTSVLGDYGVNSIPFTVLIDKEGKIVQAHLRGPALESKLAEIFGF